LLVSSAQIYYRGFYAGSPYPQIIKLKLGAFLLFFFVDVSKSGYTAKAGKGNIFLN
jgi:hypothetical protein